MSREKKWTPGPWWCKSAYRINAAHPQYSSNRERGIAQIWVEAGTVAVENRANARLIAAAPELVEALEESNKFLKAYVEHSNELPVSATIRRLKANRALLAEVYGDDNGIN